MWKTAADNIRVHPTLNYTYILSCIDHTHIHPHTSTSAAGTDDSEEDTTFVEGNSEVGLDDPPPVSPSQSFTLGSLSAMDIRSIFDHH